MLTGSKNPDSSPLLQWNEVISSGNISGKYSGSGAEMPSPGKVVISVLFLSTHGKEKVLVFPVEGILNFHRVDLCISRWSNL